MKCVHWNCFVERFLAAHVVCGQDPLAFITHVSFKHQLRQTIQRFCQEKLAPHADEIDKKNEFPRMRVSSCTLQVSQESLCNNPD